MPQSVSLTARQQELVNMLLESGRFHSASDIITASLHLLEDHERKAASFVAGLETEIAVGLLSDSAPMEPAYMLLAQFRERQ